MRHYIDRANIRATTVGVLIAVAAALGLSPAQAKAAADASVPCKAAENAIVRFQAMSDATAHYKWLACYPVRLPAPWHGTMTYVRYRTPDLLPHLGSADVGLCTRGDVQVDACKQNEKYGVFIVFPGQKRLPGTAGDSNHAAVSPRKTPAPCYVLQTQLAFISGVQPHKGTKYDPVIDVHLTATCHVVSVPDGRVSAYTIQLTGEHGQYAGKVLSVAVGRAWLVGDGNLHYTDARVIKGYPHRDWVL